MDTPTALLADAEITVVQRTLSVASFTAWISDDNVNRTPFSAGKPEAIKEQVPHAPADNHAEGTWLSEDVMSLLQQIQLANELRELRELQYLPTANRPLHPEHDAGRHADADAPFTGDANPHTDLVADESLSQGGQGPCQQRGEVLPELADRTALTPINCKSTDTKFCQDLIQLASIDHKDSSNTAELQDLIRLESVDCTTSQISHQYHLLDSPVPLPSHTCAFPFEVPTEQCLWPVSSEIGNSASGDTMSSIACAQTLTLDPECLDSLNCHSQQWSSASFEENTACVDADSSYQAALSADLCARIASGVEDIAGHRERVDYDHIKADDSLRIVGSQINFAGAPHVSHMKLADDSLEHHLSASPSLFTIETASMSQQASNPFYASDASPVQLYRVMSAAQEPAKPALRQFEPLKAASFRHGRQGSAAATFARVVQQALGRMQQALTGGSVPAWNSLQLPLQSAGPEVVVRSLLHRGSHSSTGVCVEE